MQPIGIGRLRLTPSPNFSRLYGGALSLMAATHGYFLSVIEFDQRRRTDPQRADDRVRLLGQGQGRANH